MIFTVLLLASYPSHASLQTQLRRFFIGKNKCFDVERFTSITPLYTHSRALHFHVNIPIVTFVLAMNEVIDTKMMHSADDSHHSLERFKSIDNILYKRIQNYSYSLDLHFYIVYK